MDKANEVMKPISVARQEFIINLTDLINNSMLPAFIIEPIMKDMYNDVRILAQRQYDTDLKKYQEMLAKQGEAQE